MHKISWKVTDCKASCLATCALKRNSIRVLKHVKRNASIDERRSKKETGRARKEIHGYCFRPSLIKDAL
jgi:hypothetical protein